MRKEKEENEAYSEPVSSYEGNALWEESISRSFHGCTFVPSCRKLGRRSSQIRSPVEPSRIY